MAIDINAHFGNTEHLSQATPTPWAHGMEGSAILAIAGHVNRLKADGANIANFTIGDFNPDIFPIPVALREAIKSQLDAGQTNYPPSVGVPELRTAIRDLYRDQLGLDYPEGCVQVGSGARPPIYAAYRVLLEPGDQLVYPVPCWNVKYYAYLNGAVGVPVETRPEDGFMPTAADLRPHIRTARVIALNSPLNPCGTVISEALLREICEEIVGENARREAAGERPLMMLFDQVYWQLTFEGYVHHTPVSLVPEMARYTVFVDAISKCWAGTGIRVGWAVMPPWLRSKVAPLVGHMGAWAGRAEQQATAIVLSDADSVADYNTDFQAAIKRRLALLQDGLQSMRAKGLPTDCLSAQGAIYLSARFDLHGKTIAGRTIQSDEDLRRLLLEEAGVAVVPFTAFGYRENTGWVRFSVGAVTEEDVAAALGRIETLLSA